MIHPMASPAEIAARAEGRREFMLALLRRLVDWNSFSRNPAGIAGVLDILGAALSEVGLEVEMVREGGAPAHLLARSKAGKSPSPSSSSSPSPSPILLVGHADTVFPPEDDRKMATVDGRVHGPGTCDMKGGLVVLVEALREVAPALRLGRGAVEVVINGDEELGSPRSRDLVVERARRAPACLVFEPTDELDAVVLRRKGLGQAKVLVLGRAAHAGVCPEAGANALAEMARKVLAVQALGDPAREVTVTATVARAGTSRNTVPDRAELEVDLRYRTRPDGEALVARLREIAGACAVPGTRGSVDAWLHRPPMNPDHAAGRLLAVAAAAARDLGLPPLRGVDSGGGSDANLAADAGCPSLDGLGVVGRNAHTVDEYALVDSLPQRTALAALLLERLFALTEPLAGGPAVAAFEAPP